MFDCKLNKQSRIEDSHARFIVGINCILELFLMYIFDNSNKIFMTDIIIIYHYKKKAIKYHK